MKRLAHGRLALALVAAALAVGIVVAPVLVILHAGVEWKRRAKWIAVCMMTSWIGFWFWRRDIRREANRIA